MPRICIFYLSAIPPASQGGVRSQNLRHGKRLSFLFLTVLFFFFYNDHVPTLPLIQQRSEREGWFIMLTEKNEEREGGVEIKEVRSYCEGF